MVGSLLSLLDKDLGDEMEVGPGGQEGSRQVRDFLYYIGSI